MAWLNVDPAWDPIRTDPRVFQDPRPSVTHDCELHTAINRAMRADGYQFVGVDELNGLIDQRLANLPAGGSSGPARG